jgi:DNA-directed RNA polymerase subunit RPC12/RpoP
MPLVPITVMGYRCERCGNEWIPRSEVEPRNCPKCKSTYWNKPRRKQPPPKTYEAFRDAIKAVLEEAGKPLTWTEIRTGAKLPQMFPSNQWVRRMEADPGIRLQRPRFPDGIIHWNLPGGDDVGPSRRTTPAKRVGKDSGGAKERME